MTTGDLKNNLRKFHTEVKLVNYNNELDIEGLSIGRPSAFLPILHYVLAEFSIELAQYFYAKDYELLGKNDKNFVSVIYRILRDEFDSKSPLTKEQFFTLGFAERKLQFVTSFIHFCRRKSDALKPKKRKSILSSNSAKTSKLNIHIPGRIASTTVGTKNSTGTTRYNSLSCITTPTEPEGFNILKPQIVASKQVHGKTKAGNSLMVAHDKTLPKYESLRDNKTLIIPNQDPDDVPRLGNIPGPFVMQVGNNTSSPLVQSRSDTTTVRSPHELLKEKQLDGGSCVYAAKENICPNKGNVLLVDGWNSADGGNSADDCNSANGCNSADHSLKRMVSGRSRNLMLSQMSLSDGNHPDFDYLSKKKMGNDGAKITRVPCVSCSDSPEFSKHIFVTHAREDPESPYRNEDMNESSGKSSKTCDELLDYLKEQEKRIDVLERTVKERNCRIDDLGETNSKLNARVMVLETAVALLQEKLEL